MSGSDGKRAPTLNWPLALTLVWLPYLWLVRRFWFVTDDAYITFRYSKNWAAGHGPRFNLGDHTPVEGYSNFLWMGLCALFERLGLDLELWPNLVSTACGMALLGLMLRVLCRRLELAPGLAILTLLVLALHPPFAVYSTSGLATMPFVLALFVAFERLVLRRDGIAPVTAAVALLALALLRVEGLYWGLVLLTLGAFTRRLEGRPFVAALGKTLAIVVVVYGAYFAWRASYYGHPFPNTVYAKAGTSLARLERGLDYVVVNFLTHLDLWILVPATLAALRHGRRAIGLPAVALAWGFYVYAILVSGDFMAMGRFVVPAWPFTVLAFGWVLKDVAGPTGARRGLAWAGGLVTVLVGLLPAFDAHPVPRDLRARFHFRHNVKPERFASELSKWRAQQSNPAEWTTLGRGLDRWLGPDETIVLDALGATAYACPRFVYDRNGLVSREVALREVPPEVKRSPGHDKFVPWEFFLPQEPDVLQAKLLDGQPPGEGGRRRARERFTRELERNWTRTLKSQSLDDRYVVDFRPVPDWEAAGPHRYVVMLRRIPPGTSASDAWRAHAERLRAYEAGEDPDREVVEQGWSAPRPPTRD